MYSWCLPRVSLSFVASSWSIVLINFQQEQGAFETQPSVMKDGLLPYFIVFPVDLTKLYALCQVIQMYVVFECVNF